MVVRLPCGRPDTDYISRRLVTMLGSLRTTNPHLLKFSSLLETPHLGYPIIAEATLRNILGNHAARDPTAAQVSMLFHHHCA